MRALKSMAAEPPKRAMVGSTESMVGPRSRAQRPALQSSHGPWGVGFKVGVLGFRF